MTVLPAKGSSSSHQSSGQKQSLSSRWNWLTDSVDAGPLRWENNSIILFLKTTSAVVTCYNTQEFNAADMFKSILYYFCGPGHQISNSFLSKPEFLTFASQGNRKSNLACHYLLPVSSDMWLWLWVWALYLGFFTERNQVKTNHFLTRHLCQCVVRWLSWELRYNQQDWNHQEALTRSGPWNSGPLS